MLVLALARTESDNFWQIQPNLTPSKFLAEFLDLSIFEHSQRAHTIFTIKGNVTSLGLSACE